ncbi:MAG TPA: cell division topological specificity factor MinE [Halanaerobiales bacterium]|nr:cell division topological specificity factor MinE [Halanaerobiales bacterium]
MLIDILNDILKKLGLKSEENKSKDIAKERLQFVLVHDRINLSPEEMKNLREEMLEVLKKYVDVDDQNVKMELDKKEDIMALVANFPINNSS